MSLHWTAVGKGGGQRSSLVIIIIIIIIAVVVVGVKIKIIGSSVIGSSGDEGIR